MKVKILSSLLLASGIATAAAPIDGWYSNVFSAFAWYPGNVDIFAHNLHWNNVRYKWGYNVGGAIGFKSNPLRYEIQYTFTKSRNKSFTINNTNLPIFDGYTDASLGMANVYYDFPDMVYAVAPYLGAGIGYGYVTTILGGRNVLSQPFFLKQNEGAFAWQVTGGLTYNYMENIAVSVDYRYAATTRLHKLGKTFQTNFAEVGVTYRFDDIRYK